MPRASTSSTGRSRRSKKSTTTGGSSSDSAPATPTEKLKKIPLVSMEEAMAYAQRLRDGNSAPTTNPAPSASSASDSEKQKKDKPAPPKLLSGDFGARIELPHGPQVEHKAHIFPRGHLCIGIVGASSCGKSYLLLSIIPQISKLSQVIICSRVKTPVYEQLRRWCESTPFDSGSKREKKGDDEGAEQDHITYAYFDNPIEADEGIRELTAEKPEGSYGIIVFDDFNQGTTAHSDPFMRVQNVCTMQKRNDGYHSCIVTQQYSNIGTKSRNNTNMLFAFTMHDRYAIDGFARHVNEATGLDANDVRECYREVTEKPHSYMLLVQDGGSGKLFAKRGADAPLEEVEFVDTRSSLEDIINDTHLQSLIETQKRLSERPKSRMLHREMNRVRENIRSYIATLARENDIDPQNIEHELFTRGIVDL